MAMAAEADRDLYCVNLPRLVSKFIGETEKNLARVFAASR
jgi:SpoVK/Ycf46/Vps4 family AAA+-type ATPase